MMGFFTQYEYTVPSTVLFILRADATKKGKKIPFSISKKLTEAFSVLDGSKEPK